MCSAEIMILLATEYKFVAYILGSVAVSIVALGKEVRSNTHVG